MPKITKEQYEVFLNSVKETLKQNFLILSQEPKPFNQTLFLNNGVLVLVYTTGRIVLQGNNENREFVKNILSEKHFNVV